MNQPIRERSGRRAEVVSEEEGGRGTKGGKNPADLAAKCCPIGILSLCPRHRRDLKQKLELRNREIFKITDEEAKQIKERSIGTEVNVFLATTSNLQSSQI